MVLHWVYLVAEVAEGTYGWGVEVLYRATFFYAVKGLIESTKSECLQGPFNILTGLLERVGLWNNSRMMFKILYHLCHAVRIYLKEAYKRRMTGAGLTYRARQRVRVQCQDCEADLLASKDTLLSLSPSSCSSLPSVRPFHPSSIFCCPCCPFVSSSNNSVG